MSAHELEHVAYTQEIIAARVIGTGSLCRLVAEYAMTPFPIIQPIDSDLQIGDQRVVAHGDWIYFQNWGSLFRSRAMVANDSHKVQAIDNIERLVYRKDITHFAILAPDTFLVHCQEIKKIKRHFGESLTAVNFIRWISHKRVIVSIEVDNRRECEWFHSVGSPTDPCAAVICSNYDGAGFDVDMIRVSREDAKRATFKESQLLHAATDATLDHALVTLVHLSSGLDELWWHDADGKRVRRIELQSSFVAYTSFHIVGSSILWRRPSCLNTSALITDRLAVHDERYQSFVTLAFPYVVFAEPCTNRPLEYAAFGWQDPFADIQDDDPFGRKAAMIQRNENRIANSTRRMWIDKMTQIS